jgi:alkanesulfonate monooxygenase SsuD/methylene tetrahydromethanopterin reductase-like flavin-dependent oxidoreductase (luciferase family)
MARKKQVRLAINLLATGRHNASWKTLPKPEKLSTDIDTFIEIAKLAERGKLDGIFLADGHAGVGEESFRRPFRSLAPSVLLARLAAHTKNIGLVSTIPALYGNPVDARPRDRQPRPGQQGPGGLEHHHQSGR